MTQDEQREEHVRERGQETLVRMPEKRGPGCYEVRTWVGNELLINRFKTERDADRFYRAAQRGIAIVV